MLSSVVVDACLSLLRRDFQRSHFLFSLYVLGFFFFAGWQNMIWTMDHPVRRDWNKWRLCPLCKRANEMVVHLFFGCRFTPRMWRMVKVWIGWEPLDLCPSACERNIRSWWTSMSVPNLPNHKVMATMLVNWISWNKKKERNPYRLITFCNSSSRKIGHRRSETFD